MLAVAMGREMTARLLPRLGLSGSPAMLLNAICAMDPPVSQAVRVVGVDDWAKRKGPVYGTILIDLEASQIVDLLEDRSTESIVDRFHLLKNLTEAIQRVLDALARAESACNRP